MMSDDADTGAEVEVDEGLDDAEEHESGPHTLQDDPLVGQVFKDAYLINSKIGEGGFGAVYSATQLAVDRPVAVKVLRPDRAKDPRVRDLLVKRFRREAVATSRLAHPNTVRLFDFGETKEGELFLALELLKGRELCDAIEDEAPMELIRVARISQQICMSLAEAHAQGIIHRDLKPANIFLCNVEGNDDFVKVMDFGIARVIEVDQGQSQLTQTGMTQGTPAYMSPEQAMAKETSAATDLYALGCIMYEMLVGQQVFVEESALAVSLAHVRDIPDHITIDGVPADVSNAWNELVQRLLAKNPDHRPQSAKDLAEEISNLEGVVDSTTAQAAILSMDQTMPRPAVSPDAVQAAPGAGHSDSMTPVETVGAGGTAPALVVEKRFPWAAAAVAVVGLAGLGFWFLGGGSGEGAASKTERAVATAPDKTAPAAALAAEEAARKQALDREAADRNAAARTRAQDEARRVAAAVAASKPKKAHLVLSSTPPGAMVHRGAAEDAPLVCTTPCDQDVVAGEPNEAWSLRMDGYKPLPLKLSLTHGATVNLALNLAKIPGTKTAKKRSKGATKPRSKAAPVTAPAKKARALPRLRTNAAKKAKRALPKLRR